MVVSNNALKKEQAEEFRKFIEVEVLKVIRDLASVESTTENKIKELAQETLDLIKPNMTLEELYSAAVKLDDKHTELAPVVYKVMKEYENKYEKRALDEVSNLIKNKNFNQAEEVVKKVLAFKVVG